MGENKEQVNVSKPRQEKAVLHAEFLNGDKEVKKSCKSNVEELVKKVEDAAQNNENKELYKITTLSNRRWNGNSPVRDNKGE
jgi:hypothetical protein